jgi:hypothetical protein
MGGADSPTLSHPESVWAAPIDSGHDLIKLALFKPLRHLGRM